MKRLAGTFFLLIGLGWPTLASDPGQRFSWEDVSIDVRGLRAERFLEPLEASLCGFSGIPEDPPPDVRCVRLFPSQPVDAGGAIYFVARAGTDRLRLVSEIWRTRRDGVTERIAHLIGRDVEGGTRDVGGFGNVYVDLAGGQLYVALHSNCVASENATCAYEPAVSIFRITGFDTLRDALGAVTDHGKRQRKP